MERTEIRFLLKMIIVVCQNRGQVRPPTHVIANALFMMMIFEGRGKGEGLCGNGLASSPPSLTKQPVACPTRKINGAALYFERIRGRLRFSTDWRNDFLLYFMLALISTRVTAQAVLLQLTLFMAVQRLRVSLIFSTNI
jgi:hypothetical protein